MNNKFGFSISFLYYKIILFLEKILKRQNRLYPGFTKIAFKICPNYLKFVGKPNKIICVTGTNGKTSVCDVIKNILENEHYSVINNTEWSMPIGWAHTFSKNVNLFNKSKIDYAVFEMDELKSIDILKQVKPDYIIVTNLFRDSLKRNAYPIHIFNTLNEAIASVEDSILILNADDPISSFIRYNNPKNVYYSIKSNKNDQIKYNDFDFPICPKCLSKIEYEYRHYLHIGKVKCSKCGFKSIEANLKGNIPDLEKGLIEINEKKDKYTYPLLSKSIFNAFNTMAIITLFRSMKYNKEKISNLIKKVKIPLSRENVIKVNDITIYNQMAKGQNVSATSSVFEYMNAIKKDSTLILILDEQEGKYDAMETITWLYDTDFEFLNTPHIKKIIVGSKIYKDYIPRLLLSGINKEKFICCLEEEILNNISYNNDIYILYDSDAVSKANELRNNIVKFIKEDSNENRNTL